jgi:hypothetical protein
MVRLGTPGTRAGQSAAGMWPMSQAVTRLLVRHAVRIVS